MGSILLAAAGLALAGVDPAGALIAVGALAAGAHRRDVLLFGTVVLGGTALLGTVLSLTVGARIAEIDWSAFTPPDPVSAVIEAALAAALIGWAVVRLLRREVHAPKPRRVRTGTAGLLGVGALFALSAALDPTFVALTVLAGRSGDPLAVVLAHVL